MSKPSKLSAGPTVEGGEYRCGVHDFITTDTEEWYQHMENKDNGHTENGTSECIFCHAANIPFDVPWTRPGTVKGAVCDTCKEAQFGVKK